MLELIEDVPGASLTLEWRGWPPRPWERLAFALLQAAGAAGAAWLLWYASVGPGRDVLWFVLSFTVLIIVILVGSEAAMAAPRAYTSRVAWDAARGSLVLHWSGRYFWFRRTDEVPLAALRAVRFTVPVEGRPEFPVTCAIESSGPGPTRRDIELRVKDLDRRREVMDLAFRIGQLMGWKGWVVYRSDPRGLMFELQPRAEGPGAQPMPRVTDPAGWDVDAPLARFSEPEVAVPRFDPAALRGGYRVEVWDPGRLVRISLPRSAGMARAAATGLLLGAAFAMLLFLRLKRWTASASFAGLAAGLGFLAAFAGAWVMRQRPRETVFDWGARLFRSTLDGGSYEAPFQDIAGLNMTGLLRRPRRHDQQLSYACRVDVLLPGWREPVLTTDWVRGDPERPYLQALPMAVELARNLGVPWRWIDYPAR